MKRLLVFLVLLVSLVPVSVSAQSRIPKVAIPCGNSVVPFSVYRLPFQGPATFTLTFTASGEGLITFVVNNYQTSYWARTDASCGAGCSLVLPSVMPFRTDTVQVSATAAAANCPSSGMTVANFVLQISPSSPLTKPVH
jgi:hypothetical protein